MATIKMCTDIPQSKVLATILPLESADMYYDRYGTPSVIDKYVTHESIKNDKYHHLTPCWSLAALLSVLPKPSLHQTKDGEWYCNAEPNRLYFSSHYNNPVDACVAMIEKLHELKLL